MTKGVKRVSKRKRLLGILSLVCLGMTIGFSISSQAEVKQPIKIGIIGPMTGLFSAMGEPMGKGALLAAKLINEEKGGILGRKVEILIRDDEMRPAISIRMARELNKQHGVYLFGGVNSSANVLALKPVMEEMNSLIQVGAESSKITGKDWSPNIFRLSYDNITVGYAAAELLHQKFPQIKKWATIGPDYEYGHNCVEFFIEKLKELDPSVEVVIQRWPKFGAGGGYGSHINAIMATEAEGLFSSLFGGDVIAFIREAKPFGLFNKLKVYGNGHMDWDNPYALKKDMCEIWAHELYYGPAYNYPMSEKFEKGMIKTYGEDYFKVSQGHAMATFETVYAYKAAIEKAKSFKVEDIRKALENLTFDSPHGKKTIRAGDHQAFFDIVFYHIVPDPKEEVGWRIDSWTLIDGRKYSLTPEERRKR